VTTHPSRAVIAEREFFYDFVSSGETISLPRSDSRVKLAILQLDDGAPRSKLHRRIIPPAIRSTLKQSYEFS